MSVWGILPERNARRRVRPHGLLVRCGRRFFPCAEKSPAHLTSAVAFHRAGAVPHTALRSGGAARSRRGPTWGAAVPDTGTRPVGAASRGRARFPAAAMLDHQAFLPSTKQEGRASMPEGGGGAPSGSSAHGRCQGAGEAVTSTQGKRDRRGREQWVSRCHITQPLKFFFFFGD